MLRNIKMPGWLTKPREEQSLIKPYHDSSIQACNVFTTIGSADATEKVNLRDKNKSDDNSGICIKCETIISWFVLSNSSKKSCKNMLKHSYLCISGKYVQVITMQLIEVVYGISVQNVFGFNGKIDCSSLIYIYYYHRRN